MMILESGLLFWGHLVGAMSSVSVG